MKVIIAFCLILFSTLPLQGQGYQDLLMGTHKELVLKGLTCWSEGGDNCIDYITQAYKTRQEFEGSLYGLY